MIYRCRTENKLFPGTFLSTLILSDPVLLIICYCNQTSFRSLKVCHEFHPRLYTFRFVMKSILSTRIIYISWLKKFTCNFVCFVIETGRGLMATRRFKPNDLVVSMPRKLLITADFLLSTYIGDLLKG